MAIPTELSRPHNNWHKHPFSIYNYFKTNCINWELFPVLWIQRNCSIMAPKMDLWYTKVRSYVTPKNVQEIIYKKYWEKKACYKCTREYFLSLLPFPLSVIFCRCSMLLSSKSWSYQNEKCPRPGSGVPRIFFFGEGGVFNNFSWGQRTERTGIWGRSPLVRGSGGSCNLVQEISCCKIFLIFGTLRLFMMTTNLFVIANIKQLRT